MLISSNNGLREKPVTTSSNRGPIVTNSLNRIWVLHNIDKRVKYNKSKLKIDNKSQRQQVLNKNINIISNNKPQKQIHYQTRQSPTTQQQSVYNANPTSSPYNKMQNVLQIETMLLMNGEYYKHYHLGN